MSRVHVRITEDGEVTLDVRGTVGSDCDRLTEALEHEMGTTVLKKRKPEFYVINTETEQTEDSHTGLDR